MLLVTQYNEPTNLHPGYHDTLNEDHNCIEKKKLNSTKLVYFLVKTKVFSQVLDIMSKLQVVEVDQNEYNKDPK